MIKQILAVSFVVFAVTACMNTANDRLFSESSNKISPTPTRLTIQNIQINQGSVLPPYGIKVKADIAALKVSISSSKDDAVSRVEDIQKVVGQLSALAVENGKINLESSSVYQVSNDTERGSFSSGPWREDNSSVILKLTTSLTDTHYSLLESLTIFNNFLNAINLSDTTTLQALSIGSEISNPETYRPELIAKVYQELEAVQAKYGPAVKFQITELHSSLKILPLSDIEYYLYIEPGIVVNEF
jgi:hypothetical protein